ncbi:hypothetical protein TKK_0006940 [Trichogramma kaykai]|uniref:Trafficking protein particle complex subunit 10 n=1 Tax=Trichogramma kaykai TaxID=54128 RepID=A0ABD2XBJ8_9HYME
MTQNGTPTSVELLQKSQQHEPLSSLVTYAGDSDLFNSLSSLLIKSIPTDSVDWRRSYERPIKQVRLTATFVPFSQNDLPAQADCQLLKRPIFHTYWSECSDVDVYKTSLKDDIDLWLKSLAKAGIQDWMIILVENYDVRKSNKLLPRTTVLDKIRSDFAAKHADRCLSIINPIKSESRSAESWRGLIGRIRHLMLTAYDQTISKFQKVIKDHREKRNEVGWNFCHYFLLQEELAFIFDMLGLYDEALIQYDELDAIFTQFVLNSNVTDIPKWLNSFQSPLNNWTGVSLNNSSIDYHTRVMIADCKASLLDLRSYLFSRQCAMLLALNRPWEVAQRCLTFVHDTINELRILEIQKPEGSIECWAFLCALEVLNACQASIDSSQMDLCSLHTASLWALARDKLESLGKLCGLMPGSEPTSEQLHTVVYLIAGMGDSVPLKRDSSQLGPTDQLKEALSSKEAFRKQYLYHTELAMGTYKHVNRIRSARLIGKELSRFYNDLGEHQKAVAFLLDALQTYTAEGWSQLAAETQRELADCYKQMDDVERYAKVCAAIASSALLPPSVRNSYLDEMLSYMKTLSSPEPLITEMDSAFVIDEMEVEVTDKIIQDSQIVLSVKLRSLFPRPIVCTKAQASVEEVKVKERKKGVKGAVDDGIELLLKCHISDGRPKDPCLVQLPARTEIKLNDDKKTVDSANVHIGSRARQPVKRSDSVKHRKTSVTTKGDFGLALSTSDEIVLQPGLNELTLVRRLEQPGYYKIGQLSMLVEKKMEFLSPIIEPRLCFAVAKSQPKITLNCARDLLAGLVQRVTLVISSGRVRIDPDSKLKLRTSKGLSVWPATQSKASRELEFSLPVCEPFGTTEIELQVMAELPPKRDSSSMEHKIMIQCPWNGEEIMTLHFGAPLMSTMKLHTAKKRKFVQVLVTGLSTQLLQLTEPRLTSSTSTDVNFRDLNPRVCQKLVVGSGMSVSFIWELEMGSEKSGTTIPIKMNFNVKYVAIKDIEDLDIVDNVAEPQNIIDDPLHIRSMEKVERESNDYWCNFDLNDYSTLFTVSSRVESTGGGGEFCRAGSMCHLCLTVTRLQNSAAAHQLMYEVLADQAMWAVCGRTAGIVTLEHQDRQSVTMDVMPLTSGYLPLPVVRLSRYIPAQVDLKNDVSRKNDLSAGVGPRLEPFSPGQVYNASKAQQVHILPAAPLSETY